LITESELRTHLSDQIRKTVNKFRESPNLFFTETDIHSYLYHSLYTKKLEVKTKDDILTTCLHKEYPTNFRMSKDTMEDYGLQKKGRRGNYDIAVLSPQFIAQSTIKNVINKDVKDAEMRVGHDEFKSELVAAIELKYAISHKKSFIDEFRKDVKKLSIGLKYQHFEAYSLIFCNLRNYKYMDELIETVTTEETRVKCCLAVSYYDGSIKVTPKPITNGWKI